MTTHTTSAPAAPAKALLGTKLGMTQVWDENGNLRPVTVVRVDKSTVQNLKIRGVDVDKGVLLVNGAIPGPKGSVVVVRTAVKGA